MYKCSHLPSQSKESLTVRPGSCRTFRATVGRCRPSLRALQSPLAPPSLLITELTERRDPVPLKFAILYSAATKTLPRDIRPGAP